MASNAKSIKVTLEDGTILELNADVAKDLTVIKGLGRRVDEQEEERLAEFVTSANEKLIEAFRIAYSDLSESEKLAMIKRGFIARFGASGVKDAGVHQDHLIVLRQKKERSDAGQTRNNNKRT